MISWSKAPRHSRQMFQPSGKGSIWILTTRVQATCNLESIVYITAMQLSFKGHYLRHYNSKAVVQRPRHPKKTKWTDGRRLATKMKNKKCPFYESARRAYTHDYRLKVRTMGIASYPPYQVMCFVQWAREKINWWVTINNYSPKKRKYYCW